MTSQAQTFLFYIGIFFSIIGLAIGIGFLSIFGITLNDKDLFYSLLLASFGFIMTLLSVFTPTIYSSK